MKRFAQILYNKAHWIFESDTMVEFAPDIKLIDITDLATQPQEGWNYDEVNKVFSPPPEPDPEIAIKQQLELTDKGMIRIVEDLINSLISKGVMGIEDLPVAVQDKITVRERLRAAIKYP